MTIEWWDPGSSQSSKAGSHSTHPPLQRGVGGVTWRFILDCHSRHSPSFYNHSSHPGSSSSSEAVSHSTHPPLQRGVGGVTQKKRKLASVKPPCFDFSEWRDDKRMTGWYRDGHFCDGMTLEWRDGAEKNRKGIPFENFQRVLSTNQKPGFWALDQSEALILAKFFASTKFEIIQWTVEVIKTY